MMRPGRRGGEREERGGTRKGTRYVSLVILRFSYAVAILLAIPASAADPLRMENALPIAPVRLGGPAYVTGELQWDRPDLLEGRLQFILRHGATALSVVETDPMALITGINPFRQILPVPVGAVGYGTPEAEVHFIGDRERFRLGTIPIRVPRPSSWEAVVLVAESPTRLTDRSAAALRDALNLEQAFETDIEATAGTIDCFVPTLPENRFPEQPLAYCAFDLVGLPAESFQRINGRQFDAIAAWVRAGGAVAVNVDGPLDAKHSEFLNELFRDSDGGPFLRDKTGRIVEPEGVHDGVFGRRTGLGYAVALFGPAAEFNFDSKAWREAHARLWKLREEHVRQREAGNAVVLQPSAPPIIVEANGQPPVQYPTLSYSSWAVPTPSFGTAVVNALRPREIRLMPGWAVVLLLLGYVIVVGPLDYVLLGRFRLRKWTWLTFPLITLAVSGGVVAMADLFMSDNDYRRTVSIIDFDAEGEAVRRTRLEMLFRGSGEPVLNELTSAYFASVSPDHFENEENSAPTGPYLGTLPSRYVVPQQVAKWTPHVNRTFEITVDDAPAIDWATINAASDGMVALPDGRTGFVVRAGDDQLGGIGLLGAVSTAAGFRNTANYGSRRPPGNAAPFVQAATILPRTDRGTVQYQRSPIGFDRLDDLPFLDASDKEADAIVVWTQDKTGDVAIYRKPVARKDDD